MPRGRQPSYMCLNALVQITIQPRIQLSSSARHVLMKMQRAYERWEGYMHMQ